MTRVTAFGTAARDGKSRFAPFPKMAHFRLSHFVHFHIWAAGRHLCYSPIHPVYSTSASGPSATQLRDSHAGITASLLLSLSATSSPTHLLVVARGLACYAVHSWDQRKQAGHHQQLGSAIYEGSACPTSFASPLVSRMRQCEPDTLPRTHGVRSKFIILMSNIPYSLILS